MDIVKLAVNNRTYTASLETKIININLFDRDHRTSFVISRIEVSTLNKLIICPEISRK